MVLEAVRRDGLYLKVEMCAFGYHALKFLGHVVSAAGVRSDLEKTSAIAKFLSLNNNKNVRSVLGLWSYYKRFVFRFSRNATSPTKLTKNDKAFI